MKLWIVAVGQRTPAWIEAGYEEFVKRMPREMPVQLVEIKPEPRGGNKNVDSLRAAEAARIRNALPARARVVALDERGEDVTTGQLSEKLRRWMEGGDDVAFLVGGPDGLSPELKAEAAEMLRLSSLTLPHAVVRVILAEQLYRAASILRGHPYHRE